MVGFVSVNLCDENFYLAYLPASQSGEVDDRVCVCIFQ